MLEALWSVNFASSADEGGGILVLETGRVFGGDSAFVYTGRYQVGPDGSASGTLRIQKYLKQGMPSIFGDLREFDLQWRTTAVSREHITGEAVMVGAPQHKMAFQMVRRAELP